MDSTPCTRSCLRSHVANTRAATWREQQWGSTVGLFRVDYGGGAAHWQHKTHVGVPPVGQAPTKGTGAGGSGWVGGACSWWPLDACGAGQVVDGQAHCRAERDWARGLQVHWGRHTTATSSVDSWHVSWANAPTCPGLAHAAGQQRALQASWGGGRAPG